MAGADAMSTAVTRSTQGVAQASAATGVVTATRGAETAQPAYPAPRRERAHGARLCLQRGDPRVRARHEVRAGREGWGKSRRAAPSRGGAGSLRGAHGAASVARFAFPAEPSPSRGKGRRPRTRATTRGPPGPCPRAARRRLPAWPGDSRYSSSAGPSGPRGFAPCFGASRRSTWTTQSPGSQSGRSGSDRSRVRRKVSRPILVTRLSRTSMLASVCEPAYAPAVASRRTATAQKLAHLRRGAYHPGPWGGPPLRAARSSGSSGS